MSILFDSANKINGPDFGKGLFRSNPSYRVSYTQADLDWLSEQNAIERDLHAEVDAMAQEARWNSLYEAGIPAF